MFIKKTTYTKLVSENAQLKNELAGLKEIIELQNSEDIKKLLELHKQDEIAEQKQRYCSGCCHAIINILPHKKSETLVCDLNAKEICPDFQCRDT